MKKKKKLKRSISKITLSGKDNSAKDHMVAFRCSNEIKKLLGRVENKSEFITNAVLRALSKTTWVTCPVCKGRGEIRGK